MSLFILKTLNWKFQIASGCKCVPLFVCMCTCLSVNPVVLSTLVTTWLHTCWDGLQPFVSRQIRGLEFNG